eukprot:6206063-Pleurochrysis_carterae.AAC.1
MQVGANDDCSSDDCADLFAMPSAFAKPISAEEANMLVASDSEQCMEYSRPDRCFAASSSQQSCVLPPKTVSVPAAPTFSKRGVYKRENGKGIRHSWQDMSAGCTWPKCRAAL